MELCSDEELAEFGVMCQWLHKRKLKLKSRYTAKRKPKEVDLELYQVDTFYSGRKVLRLIAVA